MTSDIEISKRAEEHALNPLKPFTLRNRIRKRIEYLNENNGDLYLIAYLQQNFDLLDSHSYLTRVKQIKKEMKTYSK